MSPLVEVTDVPEGVLVRVVVDGRRVRVRPGERVELTEDAAREPLRAGLVRLVDDTESVPTGGEQGVDKGEAVGTDADAPHTQPEAVTGDATGELSSDKDTLIALIHELDPDAKVGRFGVDRLQQTLRELREAVTDAAPDNE